MAKSALLSLVFVFFSFNALAQNQCENPAVERVVGFVDFWRGKIAYVWDGEQLPVDANMNVKNSCTSCLKSLIETNSKVAPDKRIIATAYYKDPHAPWPTTDCARCGADCSGYVYSILKASGHAMNPRIDTIDFLTSTPQELLQLGLISVGKNPQNSRPGDVVVYESPKKTRHMGFITRKTSQTSGYFEHSTANKVNAGTVRTALSNLSDYNGMKVIGFYRMLDAQEVWNNMNDKGAKCFQVVSKPGNPYVNYDGTPVIEYFSSSVYERKAEDVEGRAAFLKQFEN